MNDKGVFLDILGGIFIAMFGMLSGIYSHGIPGILSIVCLIVAIHCIANGYKRK